MIRDEALRLARAAAAAGEPLVDRAGRQRRRDRAGLGGRRRAVRRRDRPDLRARRARRLRAGRDLAGRARRLRRTQPDVYVRRSMRSMADHVRAMLAFQAAGAVTFDYGNNLRAQAKEAGVADAFDYPGLRAGVHPAAVLRGQGPVPLGGAVGDPDDIRRTDEAILELFPENAPSGAGSAMAQAKVPFQGLPARICWLGYGERAKAGAGIQRARRDAARSARRS